MKGQFPAQQPGLHEYGAAPGYPPDHADVIFPAVLQVDFLPQGLVTPDQCGRWKAQEAKRVRNRPLLARLDNRLSDGNIQASFQDAGIEYPKRLDMYFLPLQARRCGISSCLRIFLMSFFSGWNGKLAMSLGGESP